MHSMLEPVRASLMQVRVRRSDFTKTLLNKVQIVKSAKDVDSLDSSSEIDFPRGEWIRKLMNINENAHLSATVRIELKLCQQ